MIFAVVTKEKADAIRGTEFDYLSYYNPVIHNEEWIISLIEAQYLTVKDIVKLVEVAPPTVED